MRGLDVALPAPLRARRHRLSRDAASLAIPCAPPTCFAPVPALPSRHQHPSPSDDDRARADGDRVGAPSPGSPSSGRSAPWRRPLSRCEACRRLQAYAATEAHLGAILEGIDDPITAMATMACVLHHGFGHLWTGFYRAVSPSLLRVGPYLTGTLGCLEIALPRGVCGTAAAERRTIVVPDVEKFHRLRRSITLRDRRASVRSRRRAARRPRRRLGSPGRVRRRRRARTGADRRLVRRPAAGRLIMKLGALKLRG